MANYPYVYNTSTLKKFLEHIPGTGTPIKITQEYLEAAGFKSRNDRAIIPTLKFIGLIRDDGIPAEDYSLLRDKSQFGAILAGHIRQGYSELFTMYPDAHNKSNDVLRNFFATKTNTGEKALAMIISTFKTLCESADFGAQAPSRALVEETTSERKVSRTLSVPEVPESGVTINLNIQLQLPATENASIYDEIFKSLKRHLIQRTPETDS